MSTINLLPKDYLQQRARNRTNVLCLILCSCVMAGVVGAQLVSGWSVRNARQILDRVNSDYAHAAKLIEQMRHLENQEYQLRKRAELTASLIERVPRSTVLALVARALPPDASLVSLEIQTQHTVTDRPQTKFEKVSAQRSGLSTDTAIVMEVTGLAATDVKVARFITNLARSPLIAAVDLVYSQEKVVDKVTVREFQVKAELRGGVDAIDFMDQLRHAGPVAPQPPAGRRT